MGGTHYYTQSLLFKDALSEEPLRVNGEDEGEQHPILDEPNEVIFKKLQEVDPVMAERWHPNDRRKIQRSLEIYLKKGKPASQIYDEQRLKRDTALTTTDDEQSASSLRFPTVLFWVHASKDVLYSRLDSRVDKMIAKGLLSEVQTLTDFASSYEIRTGTPADYSRGIWVSIGYKEFLSYQAALSDSSISEQDLAKLKTSAIEKTQAATRQYARRQIRWIQIKLLNALFNAGHRGSIFLLDGSDLSKWDEAVVQTAGDVTDRFLSGKTLPDPTELSDEARNMLTPRRDYDLAQRPDLWLKKTCEVCGTIAVNENDWNLHVKSRAHRRAVGVKKKRENAQDTSARDNKDAHEDLIDVLESHLSTLYDETPR